MQMFPLPIYTPPGINEFFYTFGPVFDPDDKSEKSVARVIDVIEGQMFDRNITPSNGTVGDGHTDEVVRTSEVYFVAAAPETEWLFHEVGFAVAKVNYDMFDMDVKYLEALQFTKYKASNEGHYHWHIDSHQGGTHYWHRKLSIVVGLNDPSEYEGGDLLINNSGNPEEPIRIRLKKGECVIFYSHMPHCVTPVTKGERMTLVSWILGEKLR